MFVDKGFLGHDTDEYVANSIPKGSTPQNGHLVDFAEDSESEKDAHILSIGVSYSASFRLA